MGENNEFGASKWLLIILGTRVSISIYKISGMLCTYVMDIYWTRLPSIGIWCGKLTTEHALSCARKGFLSMRHNKILDLTTALLHEVCYDVSTNTERKLRNEHLANPNTDIKFCFLVINTAELFYPLCIPINTIVNRGRYLRARQT